MDPVRAHIVMYREFSSNYHSGGNKIEKVRVKRERIYKIHQ